MWDTVHVWHGARVPSVLATKRDTANTVPRTSRWRGWDALPKPLWNGPSTWYHALPAAHSWPDFPVESRGWKCGGSIQTASECHWATYVTWHYGRSSQRDLGTIFQVQHKLQWWLNLLDALLSGGIKKERERERKSRQLPVTLELPLTSNDKARPREEWARPHEPWSAPRTQRPLCSKPRVSVMRASRPTFSCECTWARKDSHPGFLHHFSFAERWKAKDFSGSKSKLLFRNNDLLTNSKKPERVWILAASGARKTTHLGGDRFPVAGGKELVNRKNTDKQINETAGQKHDSPLPAKITNA